MTTQHFADRLLAAVETKKTPLMVGLDPRLELLPASLVRGVRQEDYPQIAAAYKTFCHEVIDVVAPLVAAVKPQAAFFEQVGPPGMLALGQVIEHAKQQGLLVILDGKRNDIGSTAEAYAKAYLGDEQQSAWGCDALTVNPYLGDDSLTPMVQQSQKTGSGIFILVKTSNPGGKTFQDLSGEGGTVFEAVGRWVQQCAADTVGTMGYGVAGAVVGATYPEQLATLRERMPNTLFLVPGYGAQGGRAEDVAPAFDQHGRGALINSSRKIIFAFQQEPSAAWQSAVEQATRLAIDELRSAIG